MAIVDTLNREGVFVTTLDKLEISFYSFTTECFQHLLPQIKPISPKCNQQ